MMSHLGHDQLVSTAASDDLVYMASLPTGDLYQK